MVDCIVVVVGACNTGQSLVGYTKVVVLYVLVMLMLILHVLIL